MNTRLEKVISGGQTGVDRAALDAARESGIPIGGWCPKGRKAEDGPVPARYPLRETPRSAYTQRTEWNVRDADATLILAHGTLSGGTLLTHELASKYSKPCLIVDLDAPPAAERVRAWLEASHVRVLNVAGPRASKEPWVYRHAREYLLAVLPGESGDELP